MARLAQAKNEVGPALPAVAAAAAPNPGVTPDPTATVAPTPAAVPVLTGTHFHALDDKGRIIVPAKLRPALTEHFWMLLNADDNIALYDYVTGLDILRHCERMMAEHPENEAIAAAVQRITGAAEEVEAEGAWRVQVPDVLRYHAELDKEVVTVGALNHAVLWAREKWEEAHQRREQSTEVRRAQAEMLRAAASSIRKHESPAAGAVEAARGAQMEQAHAAATGTTGGVISGTGGAGAAGVSNDRATAAPAGDGKRGNRILTLSSLGR